tara:strand:- start:26687 stop:27181 length:495 start_codon:yes stop_codon:yes gene_type:complete
MAGVNSATLITKISEKITLNGNKYDNEIEKRITGISQVYKRIVTCPANVDTTIFRSGVTVDVTDASLDVQDVKYIRVTNLDDTNSVNLNLQIDVTESGSGESAANETATILVEAGHSFIMGTSHDSVAAYDTDASVQTTLHDLESILIDPSANAIDMEILVAST